LIFRKKLPDLEGMRRSSRRTWK